MSVDFSKPKTAWFGKTKLTKVIHRNGFGLATSLSVSEIGAAIESTCRKYPEKKSFPRRILKPITSLRNDVNVISYGDVAHDKAGKEVVRISEWRLGLSGPVGDYEHKIVLVRAKVYSGKIAEVEEMGYFLNELEANLRDVDPAARIDLLGVEQ